MKHSDIKSAIAYKRKTKYNGNEYIVHGVRGYKPKNRIDVEYSIELLDKNRNSVVHAPLEKVKLIEEL